MTISQTDTQAARDTPVPPSSVSPSSAPPSSAPPSSVPPPSAAAALMEGVYHGLTGAAGRIEILRGVALALLPGETLALTGPSGSGKSTLAAVLGGLEKPDSGRVMVAGRDLASMGDDARARWRAQHVGMVFQAFHLLPAMDALENVATPLELLRRKDALDRAREALEALGLGSRIRHYPHELSGGERQRVAVARALIADPALVIADEPTGNLDTDTGARVIDVMFRLAEARRAAILLITHDRDLAMRCDRTLAMREGRPQ